MQFSNILAVSGFAIADMVLLGLIAIFFIVGLFRGFTKTLISLLGSLVSLLVAFIVCGKVADFADGKWQIYAKFASTMRGWIEKWGSFMTMDISSAEGLSSALAAAKLPEFLVGTISSVLGKLISSNSLEAGTTLSMVLAPLFAKYTVMIISFILVYIAVRIVVKIIQIVLKTILKFSPLRFIDRILGAVFNSVLGLVLVMVMMSIITLVPMNFLNPVRANIESSKIAKVVNENNVVTKLFEKVLDSNAFLNKLFNKTQKQEITYTLKDSSGVLLQPQTVNIVVFDNADKFVNSTDFEIKADKLGVVDIFATKETAILFNYNVKITLNDGSYYMKKVVKGESAYTFETITAVGFNLTLNFDKLTEVGLKTGDKISIMKNNSDNTTSLLNEIIVDTTKLSYIIKGIDANTAISLSSSGTTFEFLVSGIVSDSITVTSSMEMTVNTSIKT